jgi:hypothetical protein
MSRGGRRVGSGRKKSNDPTVTIRVPLSMKEVIREWIKPENRNDACNQEVGMKLEDSIGLLKNALHLRANAGGKIKSEIRKAIELLQDIKA